MAGIVDGSDGVRVGIVSCDDPLNPIEKPLLIPVNITEKSLQSSGRCFSQNSDGFSTFSLQRGDLFLPRIDFRIIAF